jgi:hypothetical protein
MKTMSKIRQQRASFAGQKPGGVIQFLAWQKCVKFRHGNNVNYFRGPIATFLGHWFLTSTMDSKPSNWRETLWRRLPTDAERVALGAQPDLELEIRELEIRLTESLAKMPDVPVASNFTARVMSAIEQEESGQARQGTFHFHWNWRVFLPRILATAAIVVFAGLSWQRYEVSSQRSLLAKNIAQVAATQPLPSVEILKNFDAIQRLSQPVDADKDLLALMQ